MEGENSVTRHIMDEIHSSDIEGDQMVGARVFTRSIIDEVHSWNIQRDQPEGESMVLLEVSSMNLILGIA